VSRFLRHVRWQTSQGFRFREALFASFSGIRERREPFTRQNQILPKELVTVGQIDNVIALRTSHFLFVHAGELFFNVAERKKENKREDEEELEGQNKKGHTERKDQ